MKLIHTENYDQAGSPLLKKIAASGLSRIWQQMMGSGSFGIVSAYDAHDEITDEGRVRNREKDQALRDVLRHFNAGFVRMKGLWRDQSLNKLIPEDSLFIPGAREQDVKAIAEIFNQHGYVYGNNGHFVIKSTDGKETWMEGEVADYLRQVPPGEVSSIESGQKPEIAGFSSIKGRNWMLDPQHAEHVQQAREELQRAKSLPQEDVRQVAASVSQLRLVGRESHCFYAFEKPLKYVSRLSGIKSNDTVESPTGRSLEAFLPLISGH